MKLGKYIINRTICKKNLLLLKKLFDANEVHFRLGYGTLLGAVRENNFITGDTDVDLILDLKDRFRVVALFVTLKKNGFVVKRKLNNLISLVRKSNQIDLYFFSQKNFVDKLLGRWTCSSGFWCLYIPSRFFVGFDRINFLGKEFMGLYNSVGWLERTYGLGWRIPRKVKGNTRTLTSKFFQCISSFLKKRLSGGWRDLGVCCSKFFFGWK